MNIREIMAFRAVMNTGSMTRGAELLNITQPAVSMHVSNFERSLGFKLFERRRGRVTPTAEATLLLEQVEKTFASLTDLERRADQISRGGIGELRIASIYSTAFQVLPRAVKVFAKTHPDVPISLVTDESKRIYERISTQHYDFGIAELTKPHPAFEVEPIPQQMVCVLTRDHPLAGNDVIRPEDLSGVAMATLPRWHRVNLELEVAFAKVGARLNVVHEVDLFATVIALASQGTSVGLVDPINLAIFAEDHLVVRQFKPEIRFDLAIFYPLDRPRSALALEFINLVREELSSLTLPIMG